MALSAATTAWPRAAARLQQKEQEGAAGRRVQGGSRPTLPSLTGMRWFAAMLVFGLHVRNFGYFGGHGATYVNWGFSAGDTGVSFFFVLSGFVLMWSARPRDRATGFWRRRIARIYPVHLVTIALALVLAYTMAPSMKPSPKEAAATVLLVHTWRHAWWQSLDPVSWSLACEAFFYACFPALAWLLRRCSARATTALAGLSLLSVLAMPWLNDQLGLGWDVYSFPLARTPEFVLGAALAWLVMLERWRGPSLEAALAISVIGYFLAPNLGDSASHVAGTIVGFALLIPAAALADLRDEPSFWRRPILVRLGELSFAFYMIHLLVLHAGEHLFAATPRLPWLPALGAAAVAFSVSLALAWLLYEGVERPGRRLLLRRWRRRPAPASAAAAAAAEKAGER